MISLNFACNCWRSSSFVLRSSAFHEESMKSSFVVGERCETVGYTFRTTAIYADQPWESRQNNVLEGQTRRAWLDSIFRYHWAERSEGGPKETSQRLSGVPKNKFLDQIFLLRKSINSDMLRGFTSLAQEKKIEPARNASFLQQFCRAEWLQSSIQNRPHNVSSDKICCSDSQRETARISVLQRTKKGRNTRYGQTMRRKNSCSAGDQSVLPHNVGSAVHRNQGIRDFSQQIWVKGWNKKDRRRRS